MKRGITLTALLVTIVIMSILTATITVSGYNVLNDSKKIKFATEIAYIEEAINSYYTKDQELPLEESFIVDLSQISEKSVTQFASEEGYSNNEIILYKIDRARLGLSDTVYGNGDVDNKDIYAISKETNKVYYIKGIKVSDITYYTLTEDLKNLVEYDLSSNIAKEGVFLKSTSSETSSSSTFLGMGVRSNITKIVFENSTTNAPDTKIDLSAASNGSIVGWLDGTIAHIASDKEILANPNSSYMFANMTKLESIENLDLLNTSNVTTMYYMFSECSKLTNIDVSKFNTSNVTTMYYMFSGCSSLTTLDLNNFNTSKVTTLRNFVYNCSSLTSLNLSSFNTSNTTVMWNMFRGCSNLEKLDLSSFDTSKVTDMDYMFNGCSKLKTIYASNQFVTTKLNYSSSMFGSCTSLVGGNGTTYNSSYTDKTYARVDISDTPGYFTQNLKITIGDKQTLVTSDETEQFFYVTVKVSSDTDIKTIKFEREVINQSDALVYFKNNGIELQEDIIEVNENTEGVTVYLEDVTGKVTVVSKSF